MSHPLEAIAQAAGKQLAAPNGPVITVTCAIKAYADDALGPLTTFGKHCSYVSAMMLNTAYLGRQKPIRVATGRILRVGVARHQQIVKAQPIHRNQIVGGFLKRFK